MKATSRIAVAATWIIWGLALQPVWPQEQGGGDQQQRVAELKQSLAANQAKLKMYQWTETTQMAVKGETKKEEQQLCHYGPDGKVVKTPIGPPPAQKEPPRGIKGKIVEKKTGEMQDYVERLKSLISNYAPPDPQKLQAAKQAGNANLNLSAGQAVLTFHDYYKPGDVVSFAFDTSTKRLRSYDVNTYLDDPKNDIVTLTNQFASLPDGTNYLQQTVLDSKGKQIQITTTNTNYGPASQ